MHHLVMGDGQHKPLRKSIHHGKSDILVVVLAKIGIHLQVVAQVVHPTHVPLQVKAQPLVPRHMGPGGGLLRDHQRAGPFPVNGAAQQL